MKENGIFSLTVFFESDTWFERVSMAVIFFNCVTLGMYQPCIDQVCNTSRCRILQVRKDLIDQRLGLILLAI